MSVVSRRFTASPARTAVETWEKIIAVIAGGSSAIQTKLSSITGIAASIISDETPGRNPMTVAGNGPRLRIYCLYGENAIGDTDANETSLSWKPFENNWEMYFPVEETDYEWVTKELKEKDVRFKTYKPGEIIGDATDEEEENKSGSETNQLIINVSKLK